MFQQTAKSANYAVSVSMNSVVFKADEATAAELLNREMWNANRSLADFCLCSLTLTCSVFLY